MFIKEESEDRDIVFYYNGKLMFKGDKSSDDFYSAVVDLCQDPKVMKKFQDFCNRYGDPFDYDDTPEDTARTFVDCIYYDILDADTMDEDYYEDGDGYLPIEIFYAED